MSSRPLRGMKATSCSVDLGCGITGGALGRDAQQGRDVRPDQNRLPAPAEIRAEQLPAALPLRDRQGKLLRIVFVNEASRWSIAGSPKQSAQTGCATCGYYGNEIRNCGEHAALRSIGTARPGSTEAFRACAEPPRYCARHGCDQFCLGLDKDFGNIAGLT
jgi:hypothetical protein